MHLRRGSHAACLHKRTSPGVDSVHLVAGPLPAFESRRVYITPVRKTTQPPIPHIQLETRLLHSSLLCPLQQLILIPAQ